MSAVLLLAFASGGCEPSIDATATDRARPAMQAQTDSCAVATRVQNIDLYMDCVPAAGTLGDGSGVVMSKQQQRASARRDRSIMPRTLAIETKVESLEVHGRVATAYTSQRWERLMLQRDGKPVDTVLTTQGRRETWCNTARGWMVYEVQELGGHVRVNGKPYAQ